MFKRFLPILVAFRQFRVLRTGSRSAKKSAIQQSSALALCMALFLQLHVTPLRIFLFPLAQVRSLVTML